MELVSQACGIVGPIEWLPVQGHRDFRMWWYFGLMQASWRRVVEGLKTDLARLPTYVPCYLDHMSWSLVYEGRAACTN